MSRLYGRFPRLALYAAVVSSFALATGAGRKWY